jgi:hypothetical protein
MVINIHQNSVVTFFGIKLWSLLDCDQGGLVLVLVDTLIHINDQILMVKILKIKIENDILTIKWWWKFNCSHLNGPIIIFLKKILKLNSCHLCWLKFSPNN